MNVSRFHARRRLWLLIAILAPGASAADERGGSVASANRDFRSSVAVTGHRALSVDDYVGALDGRYSCGSEVIRATPHRVRYPFSIDDASGPVSLHIWGFRGQGSPSINLRVRASCMDEEVIPNTVTLADTTLAATLGRFHLNLGIADVMLGPEACHHWVEVSFDLADLPCNGPSTVIGNTRINRIMVETRVRDRIFRGSFHRVLEFL